MKLVLLFTVIIYFLQSTTSDAKSISDVRIKRGFIDSITGTLGSIVQKPISYFQCRIKSRLGVCIDEFFGKDCKGKFQCQNRECVEINDICNGTPQCSDSSDEFPQFCNQVQKNEQNQSVTDGSSTTHPFTSIVTPEVPVTSIVTPIPQTHPDQISDNPVNPQKQDQEQNDGCVLPPFPDNGKWMVPQVPNARPEGIIPYYSVLKYVCDEGYDLQDPEKGIHICMDDKWLEVRPECVLSEKKVDDAWNQYLSGTLQ